MLQPAPRTPGDLSRGSNPHGVDQPAELLDAPRQRHQLRVGDLFDQPEDPVQQLRGPSHQSGGSGSRDRAGVFDHALTIGATTDIPGPENRKSSGGGELEEDTPREGICARDVLPQPNTKDIDMKRIAYRTTRVTHPILLAGPRPSAQRTQRAHLSIPSSLAASRRRLAPCRTNPTTTSWHRRTRRDPRSVCPTVPQASARAMARCRRMPFGAPSADRTKATARPRTRTPSTWKTCPDPSIRDGRRGDQRGRSFGIVPASCRSHTIRGASMTDSDERYDVVFHIAVEDDWELSRAPGMYRVSTRGIPLEEAGFIHATTEDRVDDVVASEFADSSLPLVAVELDVAALEAAGSPVLIEDGSPSIMGPIPMTDDVIVSERPLYD
ncbi:DUF952 domain-containing protein [Microbacterium oryzae]|uniref:DUF952 domain-containing protein n=2 Tax=Microbacterium oryzae TaxID=743009 RepID=A0A6I6EDD5_9MICO|nr:DUF952 domain-containing protein [Microbacterium oryzae]